MPRYPWSCTACGRSNTASAIACEACQCPSLATAKEIAACRARLVERGGELQGDAALNAQREIDASEVLQPALLTALRFLPGAGLLFAWLWG